MSLDNGIVKNLISFFKTARHLWGRCPDCGTYFRMSEVVISSSPNPPNDWIRQLERQKAALLKKEESLELRDSELDDRDGELDDRENELDNHEEDEDRLDKDAHTRVREILSNETELQQ